MVLELRPVRRLPGSALLQTTTPSKLFFPAAFPGLVRMLWQTWHRELGGGERLGSGSGGWTRRSCGRGSPSGDWSRSWAAAAGMARVRPAWLLLAIWVRLWRRGPGGGQHVRPACGSALPPRMCREMSSGAGVGSRVPGGRGPGGRGGGNGAVPFPSCGTLRGAGAEGNPGVLARPP